MTPKSLARRTVDVFNRHGRFTARSVDSGCAVEIRYADTGVTATKLWLPESDEGEWVWQGSVPLLETLEVPAWFPLIDLVAKVAASLPERSDR